MRSDRLKQVMQQIDPNFDERNAGFNRFSKFVIEAGQKGVVLLNKLDNGQYEVAPGPLAKAATPLPGARPQPEGSREEPPVGRAREDGGRRGRGRRGRGGRDRGGRDSAQRERMNGSARTDSGHRPPVREERVDSALTLARAFQLMTQALSEFRSPVGQEALRLRMVAMHGREDPLLDATRFPRLLRQANDAEVADVRKVGDDDYEISAQRALTRPSLPPPPAPEEAPSPQASVDALPENAPSPGRENGQRLGLRFRRGSRAPTRAGEIPLIGVVRIEPPADTSLPETPAVAEPVEAAQVTEPVKRPRSRRPARKRAAVEPSAEAGAETTEAPPPKSPRTRSRKKPE
jgi:hypothetical protein